MVPELEAGSSSPLWYFLNRHKWQLYNPSSSSSCLWLGAVCCCNIENKKEKKKKKKKRENFPVLKLIEIGLEKKQS